MGVERSGAFRRLKVKKGDGLKTIYAKVKKSFTAGDLQRFTEVQNGVPAEEVLAKLDELAKQPTRKRKKS